MPHRLPIALKSTAIGPYLRAISITGAATFIASCSEGVLDPHGPVGKAERVILFDATAIIKPLERPRYLD